MTSPEPVTSVSTGDAAVPPSAAAGARSLSSRMHTLLLECPSRQEFFEQILQICVAEFPVTIARVDFRVGAAIQTRMQHDSRLARSLAERFSREYLGPLADEMQAAAKAEPKLKRFERGDQKMTLIAAPVMDIVSRRIDGAITLMLGSGSYKPEIVLPRLDGIAALASALLAAKSVAQTRKDTSANAESAQGGGADASDGMELRNAAALAKAARYGSTREFGFSIVNSLCTQLQAEQVFFGVEHNKRMVVEAVSGVADFKNSSPGIAVVRQAMEECLDLGSVTVAQPDMPEGMETLPIHRQWSAESNHSCVVSIPLKHGKEITGVISIRRPTSRPFRSDELQKLAPSLASYGAAIRVVEKANQSVGSQLKSAVSTTAKKNLGRGAVGRKIVCGLLLAIAAWFLFGTMTYRPLCRTRVTAADLRHYSAPFDGRLQLVHVRPGQHVREGEMLAEFDTVDMRLELNSLVRQIQSTDVEMRQAIGEEDMSAAALAKARLQVLKTQAAAVQKRIQDARITAPTDGTVVLSDLEQRVGQIFSHGEEILQFAPDGDWLLEIEIPDDIVHYVAPEQIGTFAAASLPTEKQPFTIRHIDGAATVIEDRNVFVARAPLESRPEWMRSGMKGTARVDTVPRPVWWVALHRVVDWARTNFWL